MPLSESHCHASPASQPRAFSLLEMTLVLAIIGLISGMAVTRFGHAALNTTEGEGFVRRLVLDLRQARRCAIATGVDHYVQLNRTGGVVDGFALFQLGVGQQDDTRPAPAGVTVTSASDTWRFDFDGALTSSGASSSITIDGTKYQWVITCYHATGRVESLKQAQP